jgi:hypothetical protein
MVTYLDTESMNDAAAAADWSSTEMKGRDESWRIAIAFARAHSNVLPERRRWSLTVICFMQAPSSTG